MAFVAGRLEVWKASLWASTDISVTRFFGDLSLSINIDNRTHLLAPLVHYRLSAAMHTVLAVKLKIFLVASLSVRPPSKQKQL